MLKWQGLIAAAISAAASAAPGSEGPVVVTDVRPVHSLVSMVMEGVGEPSLLMPSGASPHGYSMTPSDARLLESADIIIRVGPELIPSLERNIKSIAPNAVDVILLDLVATSILPVRKNLIFRHEMEDDDHDHEALEAAHDHEEEGHHDGHEDDHEDGHEDGHGHSVDPHAWLNPDIAIEWLEAIASILAAEHPEDSATYSQNAEAAIKAIREMSSVLSAELEQHVGDEFIVYHDAYHYFEVKFGLSPIGAIKNEHAGDASAGHLSELSGLIQARESICVFAEPQFNPGLISVLGDQSTVMVATLDPIGTDLELGAGLYPELIESIARNIVDCLSSSHSEH